MTSRCHYFFLLLHLIIILMKQKYVQTLRINIALIIKFCFFLTTSHNKPGVKLLYYHFNDKKKIDGDSGCRSISAALETDLDTTCHVSPTLRVTGRRRSQTSRRAGRTDLCTDTNRSHDTSRQRHTLTPCCLSYCCLREPTHRCWFRGPSCCSFLWEANRSGSDPLQFD